MTPSPPAEVAQRGLANELDKNFLYLRLLEAVGIECVFALVRDRDEGPIAEGVPSIRAFNRSAVYLVKAKRFSNVSSDRLGFDALPANLQDAPALLIRPGESRSTRTQQARPKDELDATTFEAVLDAHEAWGNARIDWIVRSLNMPGSRFIGDLIREARNRRGISQAELADALGMAQCSISLVENGQRGIGTDLLEQIMDILDMDIALRNKAHREIDSE